MLTLDRTGSVWKVAVAARRLDRLDALVRDLQAGGVAGVCAVRMDVRDETSIKAGVKEVSHSEIKSERIGQVRSPFHDVVI